MSERRFTDEEVTAIFREAAEGQQAALPQPASRAEGLTLHDLQAIGREVGMTPDAVARAAQTLDIRQGATTRTLLGLPIGVERRVALGRRLSDEEWEQLVVQLRDVFHARGRVKAEGSLRQWTNGNLYVLLEPTPSGHRLRLGSLHGGATASLRLGLTLLGVSALAGIAGLFGIPSDAGTMSVLLGGGVLLTASGAVRLPRWARLRAGQMESLAAQLVLPPGSAPQAQASLPPG